MHTKQDAQMKMFSSACKAVQEWNIQQHIILMALLFDHTVIISLHDSRFIIYQGKINTNKMYCIITEYKYQQKHVHVLEKGEMTTLWACVAFNKPYHSEITIYHTLENFGKGSSSITTLISFPHQKYLYSTMARWRILNLSRSKQHHFTEINWNLCQSLNRTT